MLDKECVDLVKDKLLQDRPNTYTYTKAMAEYLIQQEAETLPFAIIRPSCVGATCADPFPVGINFSLYCVLLFDDYCRGEMCNRTT